MGLYTCHGQAGNQVGEGVMVGWRRVGGRMVSFLLSNLVLTTRPPLHSPTSFPSSPKKQDFGFSDLGEIVFEDDLCLDVSSTIPGKSVQIYGCHGLGGNQKWEYEATVPINWEATIRVGICLNRLMYNMLCEELK